MAEIDSRIAMGVQPLDVGASIGRGYQLRDLAAQADTRAIDNQLKQQAVKKQATLGDFYKAHTKGGTLDRAGFFQSMTDAGYGGDIPALQKQFGDGDKSQEEYRAKQLENGIKANDYTTKAIAGLLMKPGRTPADVHAAISNLVQVGVLPPEQGQMYSTQVPTTNPQALDTWLQGVFNQALSVKEQLQLQTPKIEAVNLGGTTQMIDTTAWTNPSVTGKTLQRTATPGEVEQQRHNRETEGQAVASANRTAGAANWSFNKDLGVLINSKTGETRKAEGGDTERTRDAKDAISLIDQAETLLKSGPTGSYGGAAIDAGLRTLGVSTKGADTAAQLKALEGALVSKMPKMSGPQSDKDVAMYKQMAATIGDSTIPVSQRMAALKVVREIQERYAGGSNQSIPPAGGGGVLTPAQQSRGSAVIEQARQAIANGADAAAVRQRLQSMGIDPKGLGNGNDPRSGSW